MKKYLFGAFVTIIALGIFAFTSKNDQKIFNPNPTYYWQNAEVDIPDLTYWLLGADANWGTTAVQLGSANKLAGIEFDEELDEDGPNDGQLTKSEALYWVANNYDPWAQDFIFYDFYVGGVARIQIHKRAN